MPGFVVVPFGDADALEAAITPNTVGFLVEPIQGEAGVVIPPAGYFARVRELCSRRGVTLILDEIQTGLGRTGKLLAEEHEGIEADVTLIGKALGGGFYPVSAVLSNTDVLGVLKPGQHGSTFGGNPLACAVARASLKVLVEEGLIERSAELGDYFRAGLEAVRSNRVREVRGRGLMLAVELHADAGPARPVVEALRTRGILAKDTHGQTIRFSPPLVIEKSRDRLGARKDRHGAAVTWAFTIPKHAASAGRMVCVTFEIAGVSALTIVERRPTTRGVSDCSRVITLRWEKVL